MYILNKSAADAGNTTVLYIVLRIGPSFGQLPETWRAWLRGDRRCHRWHGRCHYAHL
jgi:hypothetical protein